jgi:hypothetical protein
MNTLTKVALAVGAVGAGLVAVGVFARNKVDAFFEDEYEGTDTTFSEDIVATAKESAATVAEAFGTVAATVAEKAADFAEKARPGA